MHVFAHIWKHSSKGPLISFHKLLAVFFLRYAPPPPPPEGGRLSSEHSHRHVEINLTDVRSAGQTDGGEILEKKGGETTEGDSQWMEVMYCWLSNTRCE